MSETSLAMVGTHHNKMPHKSFNQNYVTTTTTATTTIAENGLDIVLTKIIAWNPVVLHEWFGQRSFRHNFD